MRSGSRYRTGLTHVTSTRTEWTVEAVKQVAYHVLVTRDLFAPDNMQLMEGCSDAVIRPGERRLVVVDSRVDQLHGRRIRDYFTRHGIRASVLPLRADETVKDWASVELIVDAMNDFGIDRRREPVIAIGGGVLMDVVGFAASMYRRGTPYVRIPTTLLGLVDAGVGVKTGVNYGRGKNRLGTYSPAIATFIDRTFLTTLGERHLSNGLAEILKVALVKSPELFDLLEQHGRALIADRFQGTSDVLDRAAEQVIVEAVHLMLEELQPNLWESCLERCVDYGHTFSPTLEMAALPELLHGEAVCIDMALTTVMAHLRGDVTAADLGRILGVMTDLGLPTWDDALLDDALLDDALADTVRHRDGQQRLPLPEGVGRHRFVNDVTRDELVRSMHRLRTESALRGAGPTPTGATA